MLLIPTNVSFLKHNEHEAIYRSFKISHQRNQIRRDIFMGRLPVSALHEFDRIQRKKLQEANDTDSLLHAYFKFVSIFTDVSVQL